MQEQTVRPLRVAAYIRVSTEMGSQEDSFEYQKRYFTHLLSTRPDWVFGGIYSDYGKSATSVQKRPGFRRILRHCAEGKIDRIVCKSISRFARNTGDFLMALRMLREHHVTIQFEKENLDTAQPSNEFVLTTLGAMAQEESRSISENIRWGFQKRYPHGEARNIPIYGYRYEEDTRTDIAGIRPLRILEEEAVQVRRIFWMAAEGMSFAQIARQLNQESIPAPNPSWTQRSRRIREGRAPRFGEGRDDIEIGWTAASIGRLLRLERYTGDILLQKTYKKDYLQQKICRNQGEMPQYLVRDHHPAIISRELFYQVQYMHPLGKREDAGSGNTRRRYPYSGRIVCTHCGRFYHTRNRNSRPIWYCPVSALGNGRSLCHSHWIYEEELTKALDRAARRHFQNPEIAAAVLQEMLRQDLPEDETIYALRKRAAAWWEREENGDMWHSLVTEYAQAYIRFLELTPQGSGQVTWLDGSRTSLEWEARR
ncbi:MAG: recombinase family protein [Lachnospirales bacterium]